LVCVYLFEHLRSGQDRRWPILPSRSASSSCREHPAPRCERFRFGMDIHGVFIRLHRVCRADGGHRCMASVVAANETARRLRTTYNASKFNGRPCP
jgi:hypothetical protein